MQESNSSCICFNYCFAPFWLHQHHQQQQFWNMNWLHVRAFDAFMSLYIYGIPAVYFCTFLSSKVGKLSFVEKDFYFRFQSWNQLPGGAQCSEICCSGNCVMKCLISIKVRSQSISKALLINHADEGGWASGWSYLMSEKGSKASQPNVLLCLFQCSIFLCFTCLWKKFVHSLKLKKKKNVLTKFHSWFFPLSHSRHHRASWFVVVIACSYMW